MGALLLSAIAHLSGCDSRPESASLKAESALLRVAVSIPPQAYFARRVGGEHVKVDVLLGAGQSHSTYEPTPKQLVELSNDRVLFRIGVLFEETILSKLKDMYPNLELVDTRKGVPLRKMEASESAYHHEEGEGQSHTGEEHEHDHERDHGDLFACEGEFDPHIWLSPKLAKIQSRTICDAFQRLDPAHKDVFENNYQLFANELDALDAELTRELSPYRGQTVYVYHPAFGYFTDAYGLKQKAVELAGREPSAHQLTELIEQAKADHVKLIFVQAQFGASTAMALAEAIGGSVEAIDPLSEDYLGNLRLMAGKIVHSLRKDAKPAP